MASWLGNVALASFLTTLRTSGNGLVGEPSPLYHENKGRRGGDWGGGEDIVHGGPWTINSFHHTIQALNWLARLPQLFLFDLYPTTIINSAKLLPPLSIKPPTGTHLYRPQFAFDQRN